MKKNISACIFHKPVLKNNFIEFSSGAKKIPNIKYSVCCRSPTPGSAQYTQEVYLLLLRMIRMTGSTAYASSHRIPISRDLIVNPSRYLFVVRNWRPALLSFCNKEPRGYFCTEIQRFQTRSYREIF